MIKSKPEGKSADARREALDHLSVEKGAGDTRARRLISRKGKARTDEQTEIQRLKRQWAQVTEELGILKKSAAYFARELP